MRPLSMREAPPDRGVRGVLPPALGETVMTDQKFTSRQLHSMPGTFNISLQLNVL